MNELISSAIDAARPAHGPSGPGYMSGFGNTFETEALPGALPVGRNIEAPLMSAMGRKLPRVTFRLKSSRAPLARPSEIGQHAVMLAGGPLTATDFIIVGSTLSGAGAWDYW